MATRAKWIERMFGGLDKMYIIHRRAGIIGFTLLILHFIVVPRDPVFTIGKPMGFYALVLLFIGVIISSLSLFKRIIKYNKWLNFHKLMGLFYILGIAHAINVPTLTNQLPIVRFYVFGMAFIGILAWLYKAFLYGIFNKKLNYSVENIKRFDNDILEIELKPENKNLSFQAGQFAFVSFKGIANQESHPFTISNHPSDSVAFIAGKRNISGTSKTATVFDRRAYNAPNLWGPDGLNQFDNDEELNCITFANDSTGFVGGRKGKIFRMQIAGPGLNNGPWNLNLDLQSSEWISSISFPNSNVGMFNTSAETAGVTTALIYHTEDQGDTWTSTPDSIPDLLLAKLFAGDENNTWLVASAGKIYKGFPAPSSIFENHPEIDYSVFPNPTSGLLTINNPDSYNKLTITVTNLMGQLISEFVMENTEKHEINIEGEPGIYFVKAINQKGGQRVIKVIKE